MPHKVDDSELRHAIEVLAASGRNNADGIAEYVGLTRRTVVARLAKLMGHNIRDVVQHGTGYYLRGVHA